MANEKYTNHIIFLLLCLKTTYFGAFCAISEFARHPLSFTEIEKEGVNEQNVEVDSSQIVVSQGVQEYLAFFAFFIVIRWISLFLP